MPSNLDPMVLVIGIGVIIAVGSIIASFYAEYRVLQRAETEPEKQPHRAKIRQQLLVGGAVLGGLVFFTRMSSNGAPTSAGLGYYDLGAAGLGFAMIVASFVAFRDPR